MRIAVYCSARTDIAPECIADARKLGHWIAANGHTLVYGGLKMGLMDAVASAAAEAGGKIIGVVPQSRSNLQHPDNTVNIAVTTLHERKATMEDNADTFVALDGGYGTLDEVMSALASMSFFNEPKPLLILNRAGLYNHLTDLWDEMNRRGLMTSEVIRRITICPDIETLIGNLQNVEPQL